MPQKTNLNVNPYYEDFDANKNFYKILFRPGYSIQGRELTQVQSILQNQIESFGRYAFKQGEQVIPGEVGLNTKLHYIKLSSVSEVAINVNNDIVYKKYDITQLLGQKVRGLSSGVIATILSSKIATESSADTLFVDYLNSGNSNTETTFRQGETLEVVDGVNTPLMVVGTDGSVLPTSITITNPDTGNTSSEPSPAMGYGSAVKVEEGIYFVNGYFIRNNESLLVIDEYYDSPSTKVGFTIKEDIVTPEEDSSLYDNSIGSSNYTSPGAHRLKISLDLNKFSLDEITDKNFIELLVVKRGQIQKKVSPSDYSIIEQTLARRTYDESGDYVVDNFDIDIREYAQRDNNFGIYSVDEFGLYNGYTAGEASRKMVASISPGKAYIKGYEIVNKETKYLEINKARESLASENVTLKTKGLSTYNITNVYGSVPLNQEGSELTAYPTIYLSSVFNDGYVGLNNTESTTNYRQSVNRRGQFFDSNIGIKTITLEIVDANIPISSIVPDDLDSTFNKLWYVKSRPGTNVVSYVDVLSYTKVFKPSRNPGTTEESKFLEVTVSGSKNDLETIFTEYDEGSNDRRRRLFRTENDALGDEKSSPASTIFAVIVDYSETITPLIGTVKPSNLYLKERGVGFNSDSDIVLSKGSNSYDAVFALSYFDPQFFTRIKLETPVPNNTYEIGTYIYGLTSGAYGVVEGAPSGVFSTNRLLFVKTLSGKFLPGESIRDEDGNLVRIARENTISHFITLKRGSGYPSNTKAIIDGVTYDSSQIDVKIYTDEVLNVNILYGVSASEGSSLLEYTKPPIVTFDTGLTEVTDAASVVAVLNRNTVTTYTPQNVKSLGCSYGSGNINTFTADVLVDNRNFADLYDVTNFTFFGRKGTKFLESTSFSADASAIVQQGDLIQFSDDANNTIRSIVQYATTQKGSSKTRIYLDETLYEDVSGTSIVRLRPKVENLNSGTLLFPTGSKSIQKISESPEDSKIKYYFRRDFVTTASTGGGVITFAAQLPFGTQRFTAFNEKNYIVTVLNKNSADKVETGDIVYIDSDDVEIVSSTDTANGLTSGSIKFILPTSYFNTNPGGVENYVAPELKLTATLEVENAKPRLKTAVRNKRIVIDSAGDRVIPFRGIDYDSDIVETLSYSDAFKLRYIYEGTSTKPPEIDTAGNLISGSDITNKFTFDNGQRDTVYDVSRIVIKPGYEPPVGQIVIAFDYFEQSQGDFCTIDSYLHDAGVSENEIPSFNSSVLGNVQLKNLIDFRPKVNTSTIIPGFQDTSSLEVLTNNFTGAGSVFASTPAPDTNLEYTFKFSQVQYLDRIDGIFLNKMGEFVVKEGNSSLNPSKPDLIRDSIPLFYVYIPAYTNTTKDVRITPVEHRRYTMRDIGKLEKRIERLEYYTTLSILEQQALNMQVKDEIGLDRFKSGFFVDNFESHSVGNLVSADYNCSIDTRQSVLRPQSKEDCINLTEVYTREDQRFVAGYQKSKDILTLPFTELKLLGNNFASKTINPNPFVVVQYVGDGSISPLMDQWYDQSVEPLVVNTNTNLYNIFLAKDDPKESFSSLYNSFVVNWVGSSPSFTPINSLGELNTDQSSASVRAASVGSSSNINPQNNEVAKGVQTKTVRENIVSSDIQFFARSIPVKFVISRLKPNTKISIFLDGRNISRWVNPDLRFTGIAGNSLSAFNGEVITDENGNASGLIVIPAGNPPKENATWTGNVNTLDYDLMAEEVRFTVGSLTLKFTSSSTNEDKSTVDTYAEVKYYATGILPENPSTIVSTKPSYFKSNEGVQFVNSNTDNPIRPNPLSQTFKVENYDGGLFVTSLDLYFHKKSSTIPIKTYITNVDYEKPGKNIVPGSEKILSPETYLKCYSSGNLLVIKGEYVIGKSSASSGPISRIIDKNGVELTPSSTGVYSLTNEQVYTLVLSNHNGRSFIPNEELEIPSVTSANNTNGTSLVLTIAKDSGKLSNIKIKNPGQNYDSAVLTIESPQLPGGSVATAKINVSNGKIYNVEVSIPGFGYTEAPSVVVKGVGNGAGGCEVETFIDIDTPAVLMGVATDFDGVTKSTTPTKFKFDYPVYLQNNTEYALVVETDSSEYEIWSSRLGESDLATSTVITSQPSLGSVYKSQNTENWTEDIFEDLKFSLYRAEFNITRSAEVLLKNENLGYELLDVNPIETSAIAESIATSKLFKSNNSVVKFNHRDHGFEDSGKSYVFFKGINDVGGINSEVFNTSLYQVTNSGIDTYNIRTITSASRNAFGGGNRVFASYNRKYESLYPHIHYITTTGTKIETSVKTTNVVPVDSETTNYTSYSQTDYEKTFLNEIHYFDNQKVIASPINETLNNLDRSLTYKMILSSNVSYLSPVVDISSASLKMTTNRIENANGKENRYGRRDQVLEFYPVYRFTLSSTQPGTTYANNQSINGKTSQASGTISKVDGNAVWVKLKTKQGFISGEGVELTQGLSNITVSSSSSLVIPIINSSTQSAAGESITIVARNPLESKILEKYTNKITGKSIIWNRSTGELTVRNDLQPINDDYTSRIIDNILFSRNNTTSDQQSDIFRVGDIISYPNQPNDEAFFMEVSKVSYTNGVDFVAEDTSKNSSSVAKYVTKEVYINNPGTAINVHLLANVKDISNIEILYKYKRASSQENFDDSEWFYFNETGEPDSLEIATSENSISSIVEKQSSYQDLKYSVSDLPEFSSFAIKIVMKGVDPAYVPKIQDIRAVAAY
jgi:hypothetical protein